MRRDFIKVIAAIKEVKALEGRVYPVTTPEDCHKWPLCVVGKGGGAELPVSFGDGTPVPLIEIHVFGESYSEVDDIMHEIEQRLKPLSYTVFDPPSDSWNETLEIFMQSITMSLLE